jgi:hypothetical protein
MASCRHGAARSAESPAAAKQISLAWRSRIVHLCRSHSIGNGVIRSGNDIVGLWSGLLADLESPYDVLARLLPIGFLTVSGAAICVWTQFFVRVHDGLTSRRRLAGTSPRVVSSNGCHAAGRVLSLMRVFCQFRKRPSPATSRRRHCRAAVACTEGPACSRSPACASAKAPAATNGSVTRIFSRSMNAIATSQCPSCSLQKGRHDRQQQAEESGRSIVHQ